ncbi:MAG: J domain-containing protein [Clostridia bacterium]|nr:J domain-containing protein [Clostridia bacterium]
MNQNYYDILQVNKNASPEIIEKAYKTLAKKYHPDLQTEENKKQAEEILKKVNEAYEVLSNPEKKQNYDKSLEDLLSHHFSQKPQQNDSSFSSFESNRWKQEQLQQEKLYQEELKRRQEIAYQNQLQQARQQAYYDAYIQDLKNRGYRIRYKKSLKDYIRGFVSILVVLLFLFLLYQLPFVKSFFADWYQKNDLIHFLVDFFGKS